MSMAIKKNEPVYEEMRSLLPYYLAANGVFFAVILVIFFAARFDYTLLVGGVYGNIVCAGNFLALGKTAQSSLKRGSAKSAQTYMNTMYCLRYLGLFLLLTIGALAPFINLVAGVIPLFFPKIVSTIRAIIKKGE